jgi:hypothetical protein
MTTPLPSLRVPKVAAVKASSGIEERTVTIDRIMGSIFMFLLVKWSRYAWKTSAKLQPDACCSTQV